MSAELERLVSNLIRIGKVSAVDLSDASAPRVKMDVNGLTTDWIPFPAARAGATKVFSAPRVGEQMAVFAPYGDTGQAFVGTSFFSDDNVAPATSADQEHIRFPDGSTADYNSASNTLTLTLTGSAKVIVNCKEATINAETSVTLNTPDTNVKGKLTVDGLLTYKAGMAGSGGGTTAAITGNVSITGNVATVGQLTNDGKDVGDTHKHSGVQAGAAQTGVVV